MLWINFSENHFDFFPFCFDAVEKHSVYLSCYRSKSYTSVVLDDSEITFLSERMQLLSISLLCSETFDENDFTKIIFIE